MHVCAENSPMADVLLYWDEIRGREFPDSCIVCGRRGIGMVACKLTVVRFGVTSRRREWITVDLPYCRECGGRPSDCVQAHNFTDDGIWLRRVALEFKDALEKQREELDRFDRRQRRLRREGKAEDPDLRLPRASAAPPPVRPAVRKWLVALVTTLVLLAVFSVIAVGSECVIAVAGMVLPVVAPGPRFNPKGPIGPRPGLGPLNPKIGPRDPFGPKGKF